MEFHKAHAAGDTARCNRLGRGFSRSCISLRIGGEDAVPIENASATLVGHRAGQVQPPLADLLGAEVAQLGRLISQLGAQ